MVGESSSPAEREEGVERTLDSYGNIDFPGTDLVCEPGQHRRMFDEPGTAKDEV